MGNSKANTKTGGKKSATPDNLGDKAKPRTYTQREYDEAIELEANVAANYIDDVNIRRYAIELATSQIREEMHYSGSAGVTLSSYTERAEEIITYIRNGVASADGS